MQARQELDSAARGDIAREREGMEGPQAPQVRVSVVIPTYNRAGSVLRAARSALAQTLAPCQVIIVDDGSTDDTGDVASRLPHPVLYLRKVNAGASSARNAGLELVDGDYVFLLDSDDYWEPTWLETAVTAMREVPGGGAAACTELSLAFAGERAFGVRSLRPLVADGAIPLERLLCGGLMGSNLGFRADLIPTLAGFDLTLVTGEDIDFGLRLAAVTRIVAVEKRLVVVTQSDGSLSSLVDTGNRLRVYDKFERQFPELAVAHRRPLRDARVNATLGYAADLIWARRLRDARRRLRESWRFRPTWRAALLRFKVELLALAGRERAGR
jgi:glycosyltransferase involved in cell wall biosynthesis